jgi:hypothetical protein
MSSSKKLICKGTLRQVFTCLRPRTLTPPTPCIRVRVLFHTAEGGWGEVEPERRERGNSLLSWVENTNVIDCISSLYTLINTCRKVPLQVNFFRC